MGIPIAEQLKKKPLNVIVVKDMAGIDELCVWLLDSHYEPGHDVETTMHKQFFARKCRLMQFGDKDVQYVIDLASFVDSADDLRTAQGFYGKNLSKFPRLQEVIQKLRPFMESNKWLKCGVNLWFEYVVWYWNFGVRPFHFWDCQLAERVRWAGSHSLKDFEFYSMEEMMRRYFDFDIDKTLQTSFDVDNVLTQAQYEYAALDVRFPHSIKSRQMIIGKNDGLLRTMELENEAIGAFAEMHVHGEAIDIEKWTANTNNAVAKRQECLDKFDSIFEPIYGSKYDIVTDEMVEQAKFDWKIYNEVTQEELALKLEARQFKKAKDDVSAAECLIKASQVEAARKQMKETLKTKASELGKKRTRLKNLALKCPGKALINYDSNAQMRNALLENWPKDFKGLESTKEGELKEWVNNKIIANLIDYRGWNKRCETYGFSWVKEWTTHPCAEEGWISPFTHRIHSMYNQLIAETGRTSSDNPNGQNLPREEEVRSCFIAAWMELLLEETIVEDDPWVYVTVDMSGAELRIIADLAKAKTWIDAFNRGEDIHSVSTEILMPEKWKLATEEGCVYYALREDGTPRHEKCKCKGHKKIRENTKTLNFLLMYGGVAATLAARTGMPLEEAEHLVAIHMKKFPDVWEFLIASGNRAKEEREARDMFGRRRSFPVPTNEAAREYYINHHSDRLEYPEAQQDSALEAFELKFGRKPNAEEKYTLTHREPTSREIGKAIWALQGHVERQGKNHPIQGTNASIAKVAAGAGFDKDGKPYLFHILPSLEARFIKFVHDELVILCRKSRSQAVASAVSDAYKRAAAEVMKYVTMEADFKVSPVWAK